MEGQFIFAEEEKSHKNSIDKNWKILIADDDSEVHAVTTLVIGSITFEDKGIELYHSYSGKETIEILKNQPDIAVILLDVVMESDSAGLDTVKYIRETMGNRNVRIILRTGQPGHFPEKNVIVGYDINDYKEKTELTAQKLFTVIISSLRSYRDIAVIEKSKAGLERIIKVSSHLFGTQYTLEKLADAVMHEMGGLIDEKADIFLASGGQNDGRLEESAVVVAGYGRYSEFKGKKLYDTGCGDIVSGVTSSVVVGKNENFFHENEYIGYFKSIKGKDNIIYLKSKNRLCEIDKNLLRVFSSNISVAFDNILLEEQLIRSEKMATIGEFAGNITHEIKNPIGAVLTNSQILREELLELQGRCGDEAEKIESCIDCCEAVETGARQAKDILMNLLNYTRLDNCEIREVEIGHVANNARILVNKEFEKLGIDFQIEIDEEIKIMGNSGELTQILLNLLINARDALTAKESESKKIMLTAAKEDKYIVVTVEDNGEGMSEEVKKRIFDPYFTTKGEGKGTGLGMSIICAILRKYGAEIEVSSAEGIGTKFMIKFNKV